MGRTRLGFSKDVVKDSLSEDENALDFDDRSDSFQEVISNISFVICINTFVLHPIQTGKSLESAEQRRKVIYIFKGFLYLLHRK